MFVIRQGFDAHPAPIFLLFFEGILVTQKLMSPLKGFTYQLVLMWTYQSMPCITMKNTGTNQTNLNQKGGVFCW